MGLGEAILEAIKIRRSDPNREATTRRAAEEINKVLPEIVSGRKPLLKKRKQLRDIDRMLKGSY